MLIALFSLLRLRYDEQKPVKIKGGGSVSAKFSRRRGRPPPIIFVGIDSLALQFCHWRFSHKETLYQTSFKRSAILDGKRLFFFVFEPPLGA